MRSWRVWIVGIATFVLAACSAPPPREAAPPKAEPAARASAETPLSIEYIRVEPAPPESVVIAIPEASGWSRSGIPLTQRQSDFESCYRYAAGQVARDARIDKDRLEMREDSDDVLGLTTLVRRIDFYSESRRRAWLLDGCMRAKGNTRR